MPNHTYNREIQNKIRLRSTRSTKYFLFRGVFFRELGRLMLLIIGGDTFKEMLI